MRPDKNEDGGGDGAHGPPRPLNEIARELAIEIDRMRPQIIADRRHLHQHPELGWNEHETTSFAAGRLRALGYEVTDGKRFLRDVPRLGLPVGATGETGLVADLKGDLPGPLVALRVDIDALPITEATVDHRPAKEGFGSLRPGVMHACGHDGHLAIGLAVAAVLAQRRSALRGTFRLIAQPAEEGTRGARAVIDAGWIDKVDTLLAFHLGLGVPSGSLVVGTKGFLATRKFEAAFEGRAAHAGKSPEAGRNALLAACQAVLGLHALAQSSQPGVRVNVGTLVAGTALNVVPHSARFGFELRSGDQRTLDELSERAVTLVQSTASAYDVSSNINVIGEATDWENGPTLVAWATQVAAHSAFNTVVTDYSFGASEDATLLARKVEQNGGLSGYFVVGADVASGHHTPHFDFDESVLAPAVTFLSLLVLGDPRKRSPE